MTTNYNKTFYTNGISIKKEFEFENWIIDIDEDENMCIKNNGEIIIRLNNKASLYTNILFERFFMIEPVNISDCIGLFVTTNGKFYNVDMSQTPNKNFSTCTISLCKKRNDPGIIGNIVSCENYSRDFTIGAFNTIQEQEDNINRVLVSKTGIQSVWVCDLNGTLNVGDYITSSDIPGYGMKQDDDLKHNYTGPKILHKCNFSPNTIVLQKPINFDDEGPIYETLLNVEGDPITDIEYQIKYIRKDGTKCKKINFVEEIEMLSSLSKVDILKNPSRTIFRACLVGVIY